MNRAAVPIVPCRVPEVPCLALSERAFSNWVKRVLLTAELAEICVIGLVRGDGDAGGIAIVVGRLPPPLPFSTCGPSSD